FAVLHALRARVAQGLARHPRAIVTAIGAVLLGTGVTAFGIAPLAPDAADLPVTRVVEPALTLDIVPPPLARADERVTLFRSEIVRADDTAHRLLARLGVHDAAALALLRTDDLGRQLFKTRGVRTVRAETDASQRLVRLVARWVPQNE